MKNLMPIKQLSDQNWNMPRLFGIPILEPKLIRLKKSSETSNYIRNQPIPQYKLCNRYATKIKLAILGNQENTS